MVSGEEAVMASGLVLVAPTAPPQLDRLPPAERAAAMLSWWHENFEDPRGTYRWDSDVGYLQVFGGPYDVINELARTFPTATGREMCEVAGLVADDDEIIEWAPAAHRIRPEPRGPLPAPMDLQAALRADIEGIEQFIGRQRQRLAQPAEHHHSDVYAELVAEDLEPATVALEALRRELARGPSPASADPAVLQGAAEAFSAIGETVRRVLLRDAVMADSGGPPKGAWKDLLADYRCLFFAIEALTVWTAERKSLL